MKEKEKIKAKKKSSEGLKTIDYPETGTKQTSSKSRKEIRKQKNRNRLVTFILVMILLSICMFISLKVLFVVQKVEVVGSERYTQQEIVDFCAIPLEESIFRIDVKSLSLSIPQNFVYVEKADVQRKMPNKILVKITDAVPTYFVKSVLESDGRDVYNIYSAHFKQLTSQTHWPENLVEVDVDMSDEESVALFDEFIGVLIDNGYDRYTRITVKPGGELSLTYDNRINISLGTKLDLGYKLKMAYHVIGEEIAPDGRGTIDATTSGKVVYNLAS